MTRVGAGYAQSDSDGDLAAARELLATACRVVANAGLSPGVLGHISLRLPGTGLLVRCRGPRERGLAHTEPDDVRVVTCAI